MDCSSRTSNFPGTRPSTIIKRTIRVLYELLGDLLAFSIVCCPNHRRDSGVQSGETDILDRQQTSLNMDARLNISGQAMEETSSPNPGPSTMTPKGGQDTAKPPSRTRGQAVTIDSQKLDLILANTQSLQASQREVYNLLKALAPRVSKVETSGPTDHLEVVQLNKKQQDNPYLQGLIKRRRNRDL